MLLDAFDGGHRWLNVFKVIFSTKVAGFADHLSAKVLKQADAVERGRLRQRSYPRPLQPIRRRTPNAAASAGIMVRDPTLKKSQNLTSSPSRLIA